MHPQYFKRQQSAPTHGPYLQFSRQPKQSDHSTDDVDDRTWPIIIWIWNEYERRTITNNNIPIPNFVVLRFTHYTYNAEIIVVVVVVLLIALVRFQFWDVSGVAHHRWCFRVCASSWITGFRFRPSGIYGWSLYLSLAERKGFARPLCVYMWMLFLCAYDLI